MRLGPWAHFGAALACSLCLHALLHVWRPAPSPRAKDQLAAFSTVDFSIASPEPPAPPAEPEPEPEPEPKPEPEPEAAKVPIVPTPPPTPTRVRTQSVAPQPTAAKVEATPEAKPAPAPTAPQRPAAAAEAMAQPSAPQRPALGLNLNPTAVARAFDIQKAPEPPPIDEPAEATAPPDSPVAQAQHAINHDLAAQANDTPYAQRRQPPKLVRRADGNLWYAGPAFFAVVSNDGIVKFRDVIVRKRGRRKPRQYPPNLAPEYIKLIKRIQSLVIIDIPFPDIGDMLARIADDDPYASEKRWFLEQTKELRVQRSDAFRVEEAQNTQKRLKSELRAIVENREHSPDQKRTAVFAVWEACVADGDNRWQLLVEAFIREWMPRDSALGYSSAWLARLNKERTSAEAFMPYQPGAESPVDR